MIPRSNATKARAATLAAALALLALPPIGCSGSSVGGGGGGSSGAGGGGGSGGGGGGSGNGSLNIAGEFAMQAAFVSHLDANSTFGTPAQDVTTKLIASATLQQNGTKVTGSLQACALNLPVIMGSKNQIEIHRKDLSSYVPPVSIAGSLSSTQPGAAFSLDAPLTVLIGVRLAMPATDPMPDASKLCKSMSDTGCYYDEDGDGNPGVTLDINPPINMLVTIKALYVGARTTTPLVGMAADSDDIGGDIAAADVKIDEEPIGCDMGGGSCSDQILGLLKSNLPQIKPNSGDFKAKRVKDNTSCTDIVAMASSLFPNE